MGGYYYVTKGPLVNYTNAVVVESPPLALTVEMVSLLKL
jgi:hypothetical protein